MPRQGLVSYRVHAFQPVPCWVAGVVAFRDEFDLRHGGESRRYFWLLERGVQLVFEPYGWDGEWRVDLVEIHHESRRGGGFLFRVKDMALDIVVEGMGPTYRMLDLDDFGAHLEAGEYEPARAALVLKRAQDFLDAYLHRGAPWPPPELLPFFDAQHRRT